MCSLFLIVVKMYLFGIIENLRGICHKGLFVCGVDHIIRMILDVFSFIGYCREVFV